MELPKYITTAISSNKTSLGDHPSFPPEEEEKFIMSLVKNFFQEIVTALQEKDGRINMSDLKGELSRILVECKNIEDNRKEALEELCQNVITRLFDIPEDTITIQSELVNKINSSDERLLPEKTVEYSFDNIEDMKYLTDEIYKRRMLNALIAGASMYYASNINYYLEDIFSIHEYLPSMYNTIVLINNILLYLEKDTFDTKKSTNAGKVDVYLSSTENVVKIDAKALFFPILLEETIKGVLELAISHGLPKEREKAQYVIMKSDFKLAELWDLRLGIPLWQRIDEVIKECGYNAVDVGINFIFMEIASLPSDKFNSFLQEVFMKTKEGKKLVTSLINHIEHSKEEDEFNDYIQSKNNTEYQINDEEYYDAEELLNDCERHF